AADEQQALQVLVSKADHDAEERVAAEEVGLGQLAGDVVPGDVDPARRGPDVVPAAGDIEGFIETMREGGAEAGPLVEGELEAVELELELAVPGVDVGAEAAGRVLETHPERQPVELPAVLQRELHSRRVDDLRAHERLVGGDVEGGVDVAARVTAQLEEVELVGPGPELGLEVGAR